MAGKQENKNDQSKRKKRFCTKLNAILIKVGKKEKKRKVEKKKRKVEEENIKQAPHLKENEERKK